VYIAKSKRTAAIARQLAMKPIWKTDFKNVTKADEMIKGMPPYIHKIVDDMNAANTDSEAAIERKTQDVKEDERAKPPPSPPPPEKKNKGKGKGKYVKG
jgi:hypothetical protein